MCDVYIHNDMAMQQSLRLIELITCVMSLLKTAPVESRRLSRSLHPKLASAPQQGCRRLSTNCNSGTSARQHCLNPAPVVAQQLGLNNLAKELHGGIFTFFCTVAHRTCLWDITAMSNSIDELRARHSRCPLNRLLELVVYGHRDVTVEGHEETRHLVHCPQGHELVPERLQVRKAMTTYLDGSRSLCPRE